MQSLSQVYLSIFFPVAHVDEPFKGFTKGCPAFADSIKIKGRLGGALAVDSTTGEALQLNQEMPALHRVQTRQRPHDEG
jgi:hypothetical protein